MDELARQMRVREEALSDYNGFFWAAMQKAGNGWEKDFVMEMRLKRGGMTWKQFETVKNIVDRGN